LQIEPGYTGLFLRPNPIKRRKEEGPFTWPSNPWERKGKRKNVGHLFLSGLAH